MIHHPSAAEEKSSVSSSGFRDQSFMSSSIWEVYSDYLNLTPHLVFITNLTNKVYNISQSFLVILPLPSSLEHHLYVTFLLTRSLQPPITSIPLVSSPSRGFLRGGVEASSKTELTWDTLWIKVSNIKWERFTMIFSRLLGWATTSTFSNY